MTDKLLPFVKWVGGKRQLLPQLMKYLPEHYGTMHVPAQTILNDSQYFNQNNIQFLSTDFESAVENAKSGDFVYFDPPYFPLSETSNFTSYTKTGFTYQDHLRLRELVLKLANKGVQVMVSNSYIGPTFEMYLDYPNLHVHKIYANRSINSDATHRGKVPEYILLTYISLPTLTIYPVSKSDKSLSHRRLFFLLIYQLPMYF